MNQPTLLRVLVVDDDSESQELSRGDPAVSRFSEAADRARIDGGFAYVLERPCDPHSLIQTLQRALRLPPEPRV